MCAAKKNAVQITIINVISSGWDFLVGCQETDASVPIVIYAIKKLLGLCSKSSPMDMQY